MKLTRENFESNTLDVLDQVALLLYINQKLRDASSVFMKSPELDKSHATPDAVKILKFTSKVSESLMRVLYLKSSVRQKRLSAAYKKAAKGADAAIASARVLSAAELAADAGNVVQVAVHRNLEQLRELWASSK